MDYEALAEFDQALRQANEAARKVLQSVAEVNAEFGQEQRRWGGSRAENSPMATVRDLLAQHALYALKNLGLQVHARPRPQPYLLEGRRINEPVPLEIEVGECVLAAAKRLERWRKRGGSYT